MAKIQTTTDYRISVVIGTFNRPDSVLGLLEQLVDIRDVPIEVLVFDQSSKENYSVSSSLFPKQENFHLLRLEKPNTCRYLNMGWQYAKAPIVLYLDDDVTITSETLNAHIRHYDKKSLLGVAGRVVNDGEQISKNSQVGKVLFCGAVITKNFSFTEPLYVDYPYGCNMSFKKAALEEVGGFDEKLKPPIYAYNEVDLGYRITKKWKNSIIFEPHALVYHHQIKQGGTRFYNQKYIQKTTDYNYGYFLGKNFNFAQNIVCLIRRIPYQIVKEANSIWEILSGFMYAKSVRTR